MKKKVLVIALLMVGLGFAQRGPRMGQGANWDNKERYSESKERSSGYMGRGFGYMNPLMQEALNLSPEQKSALNKHWEEHQKNRRSWSEKIAASEISLQDAIWQQDEKKVKEYSAAAQKAQAEMQKQRVASLVFMRSVLSAEQAQKMLKLQEEQRAERKKHYEMRRNSGKGKRGEKRRAS